MIKNIMSVDLEDYYTRSPFSDWDNYESRIEKPTMKILNLFEKYRVVATFFTLGYIAKRHPQLIEKIVSFGHEISSHGYSHNEVKGLQKDEFEDDLTKSIDILRSVSGEKPLGFRAPRFSIDRNSLWAFPILKKYLKYDSSIFPIRFANYGNSMAPTKIYRMSDNDPFKEDSKSNFIEIPLATLHISRIGNFPIAGGFYLRSLPVCIIKYGIQKLNKTGNNAMFYIHPHDFDSGKPKLPGYPWHVYWNTRGSLKKLESILKNFTFSSVREIVLNK